MIIIGIDPGPKMSAVAKIDTKSNPILLTAITQDSLSGHRWGNEKIKRYLVQLLAYTFDRIIIACETFDCYGMPIGNDGFNTLMWIGEFRCLAKHWTTKFVELKASTDVKIHICGSKKAKKGNVAQALRDRFGGKGTVKNPGPTFGFASHCWCALAVAVTAWDKFCGGQK